MGNELYGHYKFLMENHTNIVLPPSISHGRRRYIKGIGKSENSAKLLLDCQKLLSDDELDMLWSVESEKYYER